MVDRLLFDLLADNSSDSVLAEAEAVVAVIGADFDPHALRTAFGRTIELYQGRYPGFRACNTDYHDLAHTLDTFLLMARLLHGASLCGGPFTGRQILVGLVAALLHDAGYIQETTDRTGTGAKYSVTHVERSMDFISAHGHDFALTAGEIEPARAVVLYTDLGVSIETAPSPEDWVRPLGELLAAADIFAQMADRLYLEKLLFLFHEFQEGLVGGYTDELDLLRKTIGFYDLIEDRFRNVFEKMDRYLRAYFSERWDISQNLYQQAAIKNKKFLADILARPGDPRINLRRDGVLGRVRRKFRHRD
ncbi:MAG: hypothetical protein L3J03_09950 [Desulfobacterales bacterium]|nr:hypothetical protein [Desulfobacterales bacterium]